MNPKSSRNSNLKGEGHQTIGGGVRNHQSVPINDGVRSNNNADGAFAMDDLPEKFSPMMLIAIAAVAIGVFYWYRGTAAGAVI